MTRDIGFEDMVAALSLNSEKWSTAIPPYWMQGRTAYGGLTAGLAVAACRKQFDDLPPLRSILVNFTGPVGANPEFHIQCLRQGRNVTTMGVDVYSEDKLGARIILVFGGTRESSLDVQADRHVDILLPDDYVPYTPPQFEKLVPGFFLNFETRLIEGQRPFTCANEGYIKVMSRHGHKGSRQGEAALVAIADVLPPAATPMAKTPAPISSMTWQLNLFTDDLSTEEGWWLLDTQITQAQNGYSSQRMKIWDSRGRAVAEGMQSVALFF